MVFLTTEVVPDESWGYRDQIATLVGIDAKGKITGVKVLSEFESPRYTKGLLADDTTPLTEEDWQSIEASVRPDGLTDEQWIPFWANIRTRIPATWGDYVQLINRLSLELSPEGRPIRDVRVMFEMLHHQNSSYLPTVVASGQMKDSDTETPLDGIEVAAYRLLDDGESVQLAAYKITDENGNFTFGYLPSGNYELAMLGDLVFDNDRDGQEDSVPPTFNIDGTGDVSGLEFFARTPETEFQGTIDSQPQLVTDTSGTPHIF